MRLARNGALFLHIVALLVRVEWLLRHTDLAQTCRSVGISAADVPTDLLLSAERSWLLQRHYRAVGRVAHWWPFGNTCLRRCLVLGALSRDLEPRLTLGVKRNDRGEFQAHSWLSVAGVELDDSGEDWAPLAVT